VKRLRSWLRLLADGFSQLGEGMSSLTLDPSPRLRRLREEQEAQAPRILWPGGPLPPLPDSAYPPDAVPLDCSGVPEREERP
jgi:hypothetical protein